jgi:uncharacterized lipoprotein NlpE involved in copper resistance
MKKTLFAITALSVALVGCDNAVNSSANVSSEPDMSQQQTQEIATNVDGQKLDPSVEMQAQMQQEPMNAEQKEWQGTYVGTIPCADCEGIETELTLNDDQTYTMREIFRGKDDKAVTTDGKFVWDVNGTTITLNSPKGNTSAQFVISNDALVMLDKNGQAIKGENAQMYHLDKAVPNS